MSALVHCDGPDCDKTRDVNYPRRMCDRGWLRVEEGDGIIPRDFHHQECLAAWANAGTGLDRVSAEVKERLHRHEWADWIEHHDGNVGSTPLTIPAIVQALRAPSPPFGKAAGVSA